jgi:hypothetical protein
MLKSLRLRLERLESARSRAAIEILRMRQDGGGNLTTIRNGRIASRREVTADEADRLSEGAITIERSYCPPTGEARADLPPTGEF